MLERTLPLMPEIGHSDIYYANGVHRADKAGDVHLHEAFKVGQYITLGKNPYLSWHDKAKYFRHAIQRHCKPPQYPDDEVWTFYHALADLVREHASREALRLMSLEDDTYARRVALGQDRDVIQTEAQMFFTQFVETDECPAWFSPEDYEAMKIIRNQWV